MSHLQSSTGHDGRRRSARGSSSKPLQGVLCLVETFTDDGLDASAATKKLLEDLGARISPNLTENITHYVASNARKQRVVAAELLGVAVVSPLWAEQCREAQLHAPEVDFMYSSEFEQKKRLQWLLSAAASNALSTAVNSAPEPLPKRASLDRSIDSPFFSSSQRHFEADESHPALPSEDKVNTTAEGNQRSAAVLKRASIPSTELNNQDDSGRAAQAVIASAYATAVTAVAASSGSNSSSSDGAVDESGIPLPSFRAYVPPKLNCSALKRRRSERISDLAESSDDDGNNNSSNNSNNNNSADEFERYVRKTSAKGPTNEKEELDAVLKIAPEAPLPVKFVEGHAADRLPPLLSLQQQREQDRKINALTKRSGGNTGSNSSATAGAVAGAALPIRSVPLKRSAVAATLIDPVAAVDISSHAEIIQNYSTATAAPVAKRKRMATLKAEEAMAAGSSSSVGLNAAPKTKVVIAMTGFDSKTDEKSTLTQMLRQLVRRIAQLPAAAATATTVALAGSSFSAATAEVAVESAAASDAGTPAQSSKRGRGRPARSADASSVAAAAFVGDNGFILPTEKSVSFLEKADDYSAASCTHVIVSKNSTARTLRVLFAIARGLCIMTEDWVYDSVSKELWSDPRLFPHPRYRSNFAAGGTIIPRGVNICVLDSRKPPDHVLRELVVAAGGNVVANVEDPSPALILFGDSKDSMEYVAKKLRRKKAQAHKEMNICKAMARDSKAVTSKYLFNCIEEIRLRNPRSAASSGELITLQDLGVRTSIGTTVAASPKVSAVAAATSNSAKSKPEARSRASSIGDLSADQSLKRGRGRPRKGSQLSDSVANSPVKSMYASSASSSAAVELNIATSESSQGKGIPGRKKKVPLTQQEIAVLLEERKRRAAERQAQLEAAKSRPTDRSMRAAKRQTDDAEKLVVTAELPRKLHGNRKLHGQRVGRKGTTSLNGTPASTAASSVGDHILSAESDYCNVHNAAISDSPMAEQTSAAIDAITDEQNSAAQRAVKTPQFLSDTPAAASAFAGRPSVASGRRSSTGADTVIDEPIPSGTADTNGDDEDDNYAAPVDGNNDEDAGECNMQFIDTDCIQVSSQVRTSNTQVAINSLLLLSSKKQDSPGVDPQSERLSAAPETSDSPLIDTRATLALSSTVNEAAPINMQQESLLGADAASTAAGALRSKKRKSREFRDPYENFSGGSSSSNGSSSSSSDGNSHIEIGRGESNAEDHIPLRPPTLPTSYDNEDHGQDQQSSNTGLRSRSPIDMVRNKESRTSLSSVEASAVDEILDDSDDDANSRTGGRVSSQIHAGKSRAKMRRITMQSSSSGPALRLVNARIAPASSTAPATTVSLNKSTDDARVLLSHKAATHGGLLSKNGHAAREDSDDDIRFSQ